MMLQKKIKCVGLEITFILVNKWIVKWQKKNTKKKKKEAGLRTATTVLNIKAVY